MDNLSKLKDILANVLKIDSNKISDKSSPDNIPSWDSFNGLILVTELEKGFDVKFTIDEIIAVKSFGDIREALKNKGIEGV